MESSFKLGNLGNLFNISYYFLLGDTWRVHYHNEIQLLGLGSGGTSL